MKKFLLKNKTTNQETLCDKVTIDGHDYYVSDEKLKVKDKFYFEIDGVSDILEVESEYHLERISAHIENKKIIATTNPNIDIPKVIDVVEKLAYDEETSEYSDIDCFDPCGYSGTDFNIGFQRGYNKSQKTHPNSDEDMIEFSNWYCDDFLNDAIGLNGKERQEAVEHLRRKGTTKEILEIWKEQKPKVIYYE